MSDTDTARTTAAADTTDAMDATDRIGWPMWSSSRGPAHGRATAAEVLASPGYRRWLLGAGVWLFYVAQPVYALLTHGQPWWPDRIVGLSMLAVFVSVYLLLTPFGFAGFRWVRWFVPFTMLGTLLVYLDYGQAGDVGLVVYIGVAMVVLWPRRWSVLGVLALFLAAVFVPQEQHLTSWHVTSPQWSNGLSLVLASVLASAFIGIGRRNHELRAVRSEVVRMAAEEERNRIARDMHDILGHTLTTVTVKASLAQRLVELDPARAVTEMAEVESLARQGLADVRAVIGGYREISVGSEIAAAREVLRAAGIEPDLPTTVDEVRPELNELFGWAVREGVTNVVRHSSARTCGVRLEPYAVEISDDGAGAGSAVAPGAGGTGLTGLRERAAALGARVEAGPTGHGFRLRVDAHP